MTGIHKSRHIIRRILFTYLDITIVITVVDIDTQNLQNGLPFQVRTKRLKVKQVDARTS